MQMTFDKLKHALAAVPASLRTSDPAVGPLASARLTGGINVSSAVQAQAPGGDGEQLSFSAILLSDQQSGAAADHPVRVEMHPLKPGDLRLPLLSAKDVVPAEQTVASVAGTLGHDAVKMQAAHASNNSAIRPGTSSIGIPAQPDVQAVPALAADVAKPGVSGLSKVEDTASVQPPQSQSSDHEVTAVRGHATAPEASQSVPAADQVGALVDTPNLETVATRPVVHAEQDHAPGPLSLREPATHLQTVPAIQAAPSGDARALSSIQAPARGGTTAATEQSPLTEAWAVAEPHVMVSTSAALEVGVRTEEHGWVRVRAEAGAEGSVSAAVVASSPAEANALAERLPALAAYLHTEQVLLTGLAVQVAVAATAAEVGSGQQQAAAQQGRQSRSGPDPAELVSEAGRDVQSVSSGRGQLPDGRLSVRV